MFQIVHRKEGVYENREKLFSLVLAGALFLQVGLPAAQAAGEQSQAQQYAQQVAYQTEAEGIVLLKNKNNCLPLEGKQVNVFGAASVKPYYGGGGSGQIDSSDVTDFIRRWSRRAWLIIPS